MHILEAEALGSYMTTRKKTVPEETPAAKPKAEQLSLTQVLPKKPAKVQARAQAPKPPGYFLDKILDIAVEIKQSPEAAEPAYMARHLVQCTLPHSDPGDVPIWRRRNGNLTLSIRPMLDAKTNKPLYPYGTIPRLFLFWAVTEATRTKSRRISLGKTLSDFMRVLGLNSRNGSGGRSDSARLKDHMVRLFRATVSIDNEDDRQGSWLDIQVAPKGQMWWDPAKPAESNLWDSWIELSEDFYNMVTTSSVPVDMRALKALKRSALALDLYAWLTYTVFAANKRKEPRRIPWQGLHDQMGGGYAEVRFFKVKALAAIKKIQLVYPELKVSSTSTHLLVHPAATAIANKGFRALN